MTLDAVSCSQAAEIFNTRLSDLTSENSLDATNVAKMTAYVGGGATVMAYTGKVIFFGVLAASLTLGAMQLASGHDLTAGLLNAEATSLNVNRTAKTDRAAFDRRIEAPMQTISVRLSEFNDTSFLLRIPATPSGPAAVSGNTRTPPSQILISTDGSKGEEAKRQVACEPMVSVLTEIAKRLQPGRCVT